MSESIYYCTDGRYVGTFYSNGKRWQVSSKSRKDCEERIKQKKKELAATSPSCSTTAKKHQQYSISNYFDYWFSNYKSKVVKESTSTTLTNIFNRYVRNEIGSLSIKTMERGTLQAFIESIPASSGRKVVMTLFKELFLTALNEGVIKFNPMALVFLPRTEHRHNDQMIKESKYLTYFNETKFLNCLIYHKSDIRIPFIVALYTGMRRGELLGLKWSNIDFDNHRIIVDHQWNYMTKSDTSPKTSASYRVIPLLPQVENALKEVEHREDTEYLFSQYHRFTSLLVYWSKQSGVHVTPHMLRHTFASRLYAINLDPKRIQSVMGHESLAVTMDTYTHIVNNTDKEILTQMRDYFQSIGWYKDY